MKIISFLFSLSKIILYFCGLLFIILMFLISTGFFEDNGPTEFGSAGGKATPEDYLTKKLKQKNILIHEEDEITIKEQKEKIIIEIKK